MPGPFLLPSRLIIAAPIFLYVCTHTHTVLSQADFIYGLKIITTTRVGEKCNRAKWGKKLGKSYHFRAHSRKKVFFLNHLCFPLPSFFGNLAARFKKSSPPSPSHPTSFNYPNKYNAWLGIRRRETVMLGPVFLAYVAHFPVFQVAKKTGESIR